MYLGLDLGTSGFRGLLVSAQGGPVGDASTEYAVQTPREGWSEQNPAVWINACQEVASRLRSEYPGEFKAIKGIGVAGHMHGATTLDRYGKIVRPCILWNDIRAAAEAAELDAMPQFRSLSGNIVLPGLTAPKLKWMARHEPDNFARVAKVLLPKDYLVFGIPQVRFHFSPQRRFHRQLHQLRTQLAYIFLRLQILRQFVGPCLHLFFFHLLSPISIMQGINWVSADQFSPGSERPHGQLS